MQFWLLQALFSWVFWNRAGLTWDLSLKGNKSSVGFLYNGLPLRRRACNVRPSRHVTSARHVALLRRVSASPHVSSSRRVSASGHVTLCNISASRRVTSCPLGHMFFWSTNSSLYLVTLPAPARAILLVKYLQSIRLSRLQGVKCTALIKIDWIPQQTLGVVHVYVIVVVVCPCCCCCRPCFCSCSCFCFGTYFTQM